MFDPQKIATVIALYNDENRIARAIDSAANSICPIGIQHEVIVVDDASTDASLDAAHAAKSSFDNVRVISMPENGGPAKARNFALARTDAAWFLPIDSDDVVEPQRMATLYRFAVESGSDMVADNLFLSHESEPKTVTRLLWPQKPEGQVKLTAEFFIRRCYDVELARSELGFLKPLIDRRTIKPSAQRPYLGDVRFGEDYELYARMLLDGASALLVDPLGYYLVQRDHSASRSQGANDHRRLAEINETFLERDGLSRAATSALRGFLTFSRREWAMWALMDAVGNRSLPRAIKALSISVDASSHVFARLLGSLPRRIFSR